MADTPLKPIQEWDEDFVAGLPAGELDWLEFKASEKFAASDWRDEISKYVSAWANYDGGYIIFGVKDPRDGNPLEIDGGIAGNIKPNLATWIDQVVPSLVDPPLPKLTSWLISPKAKDSRISSDHVLVVIHIPESPSAPHQASDHKYYQRLGRKLSPLRHRAVMDIIGRRRHPEVETQILVHLGPRGNRLFWRLTNTGNILAVHWKAVIQFPVKIGNCTVGFKDEPAKHGTNDRGQTFLELRIARHAGAPLFPKSDVSRTFELCPVDYKPPFKSSTDEVIVTTFADEMPAKTEVFPLKDVIREHSL
jgi:hypothetical protein